MHDITFTALQLHIELKRCAVKVAMCLDCPSR
jgi:hypothetical protein